MVATFALAALSACSPQTTTALRPPPLQPAPIAAVSSTDIPPLEGVPGPVDGQVIEQTAGTNPQDIQAIPELAAAKTGVVPQGDVTVGPDIEFGKNQLLGAWNVATTLETCPMSMSLTTWTGGFRAATRKCTDETLKQISAWQLGGKQLTLLDTQGETLARLFPSGPNRFDGTTEIGGKAISVFR